MPHLTHIPRSLHSTDHELTSLIRILEDFAHRKHAAPFVPRFDLEEHTTSYELYGEFPGVKPADIVVSALDDHSLEVRGFVRPHSIWAEETAGVEHSVAVQHPHGTPPKSAGEEAAVTAETARHSLEPRDEELHFPAHREAGEEVVLQPEVAAAQQPVEEQPVAEERENKEEEKKEEPKEDKITPIITERQTGEFHRIFHFRTPVELGEGVRARMDNGVLHVSIPRGPTPPPHKAKQVDVHWVPYYGL